MRRKQCFTLSHKDLVGNAEVRCAKCLSADHSITPRGRREFLTLPQNVYDFALPPCSGRKSDQGDSYPASMAVEAVEW